MSRPFATKKKDAEWQWEGVTRGGKQVKVRRVYVKGGAFIQAPKSGYYWTSEEVARDIRAGKIGVPPKRARSTRKRGLASKMMRGY